MDLSKDRMTSRERVHTVFEGGIPDRVPLDYSGNSGIDARLRRALGAKDDEEMKLALGVDFRYVEAPYAGPPLFDTVPGRQVDPLYGFHTRWVENDSGGYWDFCDFPLEFYDLEQIEAFPFPDPDAFDYDAALDYCRAHRDKALFAGHAGIVDILNSTGRIRGVEQTLVDLALDDEAGLCYMRRKADNDLAIMERLIDKCRDELTFLWTGEDLGSQHVPLISQAMLEKHILPSHHRFIDLAASYGLPTMMHSCGSSSWAYPSFIQLGLRGVDTLQPEAANMSPAYLKATFGGSLVFHGCISTAGALAYGTVADVETCVRDTLDVMMPGGGYMCAPTHQVQDNSPTENVLAMYEAALRYGYYA